MAERPSVLALTRQGLPTVRGEAGENFSAYGAYILAPASQARKVTLIASGSEVEIALDARQRLEDEGMATAVVSMPCWELFAEQTAHYRDEVLSPGSLHIAVEAAGPFGWERWVGPEGAVVGMKSFGASAPADALYEHFKITADAVIEAVKARL